MIVSRCFGATMKANLVLQRGGMKKLSERCIRATRADRRPWEIVRHSSLRTMPWDPMSKPKPRPSSIPGGQVPRQDESKAHLSDERILPRRDRVCL